MVLRRFDKTLGGGGAESRRLDKERVHMRKFTIVGAIMAGLLLSGCSGQSEGLDNGWSMIQTENYAGSFIRGDFSADETLVEAGGNTAASSGIQIFRVTFAPKLITSGQILTIQVSVQHQNGVVI